jgi:hypothetical protein
MVDAAEFLVINPRTRQPGDPLYQPSNTPVPTMGEPGVILKVLKETPNPHSQHLIMNTPCIPVPRRQLGVLESATNETQKHVTPLFNKASDFMTLRWRKYGESERLK